jgi:hypothetical protein
MRKTMTPCRTRKGDGGGRKGDLDTPPPPPKEFGPPRPRKGRGGKK